MEKLEKSTPQRVISVDGVAYDVAAFVNEHPGGDILLHFEGCDATEAFYAYHSEVALKRLRLLPRVGKGVKVLQEDTRFAELRREFERNGLLRSSGLWYFYKTSTTFLLLVSSWALLHFLPFSLLTTAAACVCLGLFWQQSGWLSHEYCHHCVFSYGPVNTVFNYMTGNVWQGFSVLWWKDRHNKHHASSNTIGVDPDMDNLPAMAWDALDIARLRASYGPRSLFARLISFQHVYFLPFISLLAIIWNLQSLFFVRSLRDHPNRVLRGKYRVEVATMVAHYAWIAAFCLAYMPNVWAALAFYVAAKLVSGWCIGIIVFFTHYSCEHFDGVGARPSWVRTQVLSSCNIRPGPIVDWFAGGINYQIEHHLFPSIGRHHFPEARRRVIQFCKEMDIRHEELSFLEGTRRNLAHLKKVASLLNQN